MMIGMYDYNVVDKEALASSFIVGYLIITKIILINFLLASLGTTYNALLDVSIFLYQKKQYEFIERYSIAMSNEWGYNYLVILPPPLNIFSLFLLPSIFRKGLMKRSAEMFSKFIFWFENMFFLVAMFVYLSLHVPLLYLRMIFNIIRYWDILNILWLLAFWIIIGPLFLTFAVFKDLFQYMKVMCDYKDEDDLE